MSLISELGTRIKLIRVYSGVKQKILANELGIPAPLLSMYEQGKREPSITFLHAFSNRFNMSLSQFFTFQGLPKENKTDKDFKDILVELNSILKDYEKDKLKMIDA